MINLLSELYPIQPQLAFYKVDDKIVLKAQEVRQKLAYKLEAPAEYFDFPADSLRFYDFKKFMDFFNTNNLKIRLFLMLHCLNLVKFLTLSFSRQKASRSFLIGQ